MQLSRSSKNSGGCKSGMLNATCVPAHGMIPVGGQAAGFQPGPAAGAATSATRSLSQPAPAAIQRLASRIIGARKASGRRGHTATGSDAMAQPYRWVPTCHRSASHVPWRWPLTSTPRGQGAKAQHTPHPLQGSPAAGLAGASRCKWITAGFMCHRVCRQSPVFCQQNKRLGGV